MSRIAWNALGERYFETGVDRGVLYTSDSEGVPWTGLISVSENPNGGEAKPYYIDGFKYLQISSAEEFEATIEAFYAPKEFGACDGTAQIHNGLFATQQPRKAFGLSYRTKIGNDLDGQDHAYKIHLVYNALAAPATRDHKTIGQSVDPSAFSWDVTTMPPSLTGHKPTAHMVIDSLLADPAILTQVEDILYGSESEAPRLPTPDEMVTLFAPIP